MSWLIRKDLLRFLADRQGALMAVLLPVVLASLLGMLFAPRDGAATIKLLVADADGGASVRALIKAIDQSSNFKFSEVTEQEARAQLAAGDASLALLLPMGSNEVLKPANMFGGKQGQATLLCDPSDSTEADMATGLLTQILMQQTMRGLSDRKVMRSMFEDLERGLDDSSPAEMHRFFASGKALADRPGQEGADSAAEMKPPLAFQRSEVVASGPAAGYNSYAHNFAGMLLLFLLFGAQGAAKQLVTDRDNGTLLRIRLAPLRPAMVLLCTGLSSMIIAAMTSAAVYVVGMIVFGIRVASWPGFLLMVASVSAFVGGFALLLAGLGRTEQQIGSIGSFVVLVMSFAGGAMFPSFLMPEWLQRVSQVLPTYWATRGLAAMTWRGMELPAAMAPAAVLLTAAMVCAAIGIRRFRWS